MGADVAGVRAAGAALGRRQGRTAPGRIPPAPAGPRPGRPGIARCPARGGHRRRGRPFRVPQVHTQAGHGLPGASLSVRQGKAGPPRGGGRLAPGGLQQPPALLRLRPVLRRAAAQSLLLQQSARGLRDLPRLRPLHRPRPRPGNSGPVQVHRRRRHQAMDHPGRALGGAGAQEVLRAQGHPAGPPLRRARRRRPPADHRRRRKLEGREVLRNPRLVPVAGAEELQDARPRVPGALPALRDLHRLPGDPAQARGPELPDRREQHRGRQPHERSRRPRLLSVAGAREERRSGRESGAPRDPPAPGLSHGRGPGVPDPRPAVPDAVRRRARAGGPDHRHRLVPGEYAVRAGRALHRPASAGQPPSGGDPSPPPLQQQYRGGGGARPGDHQGERLRHRPGPAGG